MSSVKRRRPQVSNLCGSGAIENDLRAVQQPFTRPIPKFADAQMRYLVKQLKTTRAAAVLLGISQRTVECYVKDQINRPRPELSQRLEDAVRQRWQPRICAQTTGRHPHWHRHRHPRPLRLHRRTRHHRRRPYPPPPRLPSQYAARLFDAQQAEASERQLCDIAAEGLGEIYFRDGGRRVHGLEVEFTDVEHVEFDLKGRTRVRAVACRMECCAGRPVTARGSGRPGRAC